MRLRLGVILFLLMGLISEAQLHAEDSGAAPQGLDLQALGSLVLAHPGLQAFEFGGAFLFQPDENHEVYLGPRIGFLMGGDDHASRFDLNTGLEAELTFVNLAGPGIAVDFVAPSFSGGALSDSHFRFEGFLNFRFLHFQNAGAWAVRLGTLWDTRYQWGAKLGITLQLGGVLKIGDE